MENLALVYHALAKYLERLLLLCIILFNKRYTDAILLYKEILRIKRLDPKRKYWDIIRIQNNYGQSLFANGSLSKAKKLYPTTADSLIFLTCSKYDKVYKIITQLRGASHSSVAVILENIAKIYQRRSSL